jgi:hypothetical protein
MRRLAGAILAATLLAGCASTPRSSASRADQAWPVTRRCSPADPDRGAWFCVVGQFLHGAAAFFSPANETATR